MLHRGSAKGSLARVDGSSDGSFSPPTCRNLARPTLDFAAASC